MNAKKLFSLLFLIDGFALFGAQDIIHRNFFDTHAYTENSKTRLKIYVFFSKTHDVFFKNYFLPSLSSVEPDYELNIYSVDQLSQSGTFLSQGWNATMLKKNEMILEAIYRHYGQLILYSDVDIQFLQPFSASLNRLISNYDLVVQKDNPSGVNGACAGFVFMKCNAKTFELYQKIRLAMLADGTLRDQIALNKFLSMATDLKWRYLPEAEYFSPRKQWTVGAPLDVTSLIKMHHANWTEGIDSKLAQLDAVKNKFAGLHSDQK